MGLGTTATGVVVAMLLLTACQGPADQRDKTGQSDAPTSRQHSSVRGDAAATPEKPPKLGDPSSNSVKARWLEIREGCVLYKIAPTVDYGDPVDLIRVSDECGGQPPVKQARALIPKGTTACLNEVSNAVETFVEVRLPSEFYECQAYESRVVGR